MAKGGIRVGAGRKKGSTGAASDAKKKLAASILPDKLETALWNKYLHHSDEKIAWEAFKLAKSYKSGKPVQPMSGENGNPIPVQIVTNASLPHE